MFKEAHQALKDRERERERKQNKNIGLNTHPWGTPIITSSLGTQTRTSVPSFPSPHSKIFSNTGTDQFNRKSCRILKNCDKKKPKTNSLNTPLPIPQSPPCRTGRSCLCDSTLLQETVRTFFLSTAGIKKEKKKNPKNTTSLTISAALRGFGFSGSW